jgi:uncharacterized protein (TIGR02145 family)
MKKVISKLAVIMLFTFSFLLLTVFAQRQQSKNTSYNQFTDSRDGKTYKTVVIGTQIWMAENLAYKASSGCWAYNNDTNNVATYGYLYNWETAKIVCPAGWHLPTDDEWVTLINYLDGEKVAGGKLKSTTGWDSPNTGATNESGFTALPAGCYHDDSFYVLGMYADFWTATVYTEKEKDAWYWFVYSGTKQALHLFMPKSHSFSVRCVKDK